MARAEITQELREILSDPWKRLCHLYWIKDRHGKKIKFTPNVIQEQLYRDMWYLNVVLKARQEGVTTLIQLFLLDRCLFNDNITAGVIAHNREDAEKFFRDKIKFAYDSLPEQLKAAIPARNDNAGELVFGNGSQIRVGTSMRSGTLQYLHISEFGKICAKYPDKAQEIISGSLNTVAPGQFVFIESTAEGAYGRFFDMCQTAEKLQMSGDPLTKMDYRFFFFPWYKLNDYVLEGQVRMTAEIARYFEELEEEHGVKLTREQKNWYIKKLSEQGDTLMLREFPTTSVEAFQAIVEGAIFGKEMRAARKERRICRIPIVQGVPVNTFWDLGRNDTMSIWFHQRVGFENRFIDYYEDSLKSLQSYAKVLKEKGYLYGTHYMPHDIGVTDLTQGENLTRKEVAEKAGIRPIIVVPRIENKNDAIEMARQALPTSWFDVERCDKGVKALENYRYEWNEKLEVWMPKPLENWACHPADAFMQFGQGYRAVSAKGGARHVGMY